MRKSRLKILPARCLTTLGFLLLYLACPVIGDMSRTRPGGARHALMLQRASGPDNPGDGETPGYREHEGSTDASQDLLTPTSDAPDDEWTRCAGAGTNRWDLPRAPSASNKAAGGWDSEASPVAPDICHARALSLTVQDRGGKVDSFRRVSRTNVLQTRQRRFLTPPSKSSSGEERESRRVVRTGPETRQAKHQMFRGNSYLAEFKPLRSSMVTRRHALQRRSTGVEGVRRETRVMSLARRRTDNQRRTALVRNDNRILERRTTARDMFSENRKLPRYSTRLGTAETRRVNERARTNLNDSPGKRRISTISSVVRKFAGHVPSVTNFQTNRRIFPSASNSRRLQIVTSLRRTSPVNIYKYVTMPRSTNRRLYREHSDTRNIRYKEMNVPVDNVMSRRISQERSTDRRVLAKVFQVPSLSKGTLISRINAVRSLGRRSLPTINYAAASRRMSQDVNFLKSYSESNIDKRSVFRGRYISGKQSRNAHSIIRKNNLVRSFSEGSIDSRRMHMSRVTNSRLSAEQLQTRRLVRAVIRTKRDVPEVSQIRRISRVAIRDNRMYYSSPETRRMANSERRGRQGLPDVSVSRRLTRILTIHGRISSELATARVISRDTLSRKNNRVSVLSARRLSSAVTPSRRISVRIIPSARRQGEFSATKRLVRELPTANRNPSGIPDSGRLISSRSSNSRSTFMSKSSTTGSSVKGHQKKQLVRGVALARDNARITFSRRTNFLTNKLNTGGRRLVRVTSPTRLLSRDSFDKLRTSRRTSGKRISLVLPNANTRESRGLTLVARYSAEGRKSRAHFGVTFMNPAVYVALTNTRMSKLETPMRSWRDLTRVNSRRMRLTAGPAKTSSIRISAMATSKNNRLINELLASQRLVREVSREGKMSITSRVSRFSVTSSTRSRFFNKKPGSRKLSLVESTRRRTLTNELRTARKSSGRFMERRLVNTKLSEARDIVREVNQANRMAMAERKVFVPNKFYNRQYSSGEDYTRRYSKVVFQARRVRTEQQSVRRTSISRQISTNDLKARVLAVRSENKLHLGRNIISRSTRDVRKTRENFENSSTRRYSTVRTRMFNTASIQRFNTANTRRFNTIASANRRVLQNSYRLTSLANAGIMTTRRSVNFTPIATRRTFGDNVNSHQLSYMERTPEYSQKIAATDATRRDYNARDPGLITNTYYSNNFFVGDSHLGFETTINISLMKKASQQSSNSTVARLVSSTMHHISAIQTRNESADIISPNSRKTTVPKSMPPQTTNQEIYVDVPTMVSNEIKNNWYSIVAKFPKYFISVLFTYLSKNLSNTGPEFGLQKFCKHHFDYDIFQDVKEQIFQFGTTQMLKNSLVPDVGDIKKSSLLPDDVSGLGLVTGGLAGTALLLTTSAKFY